MGCAAVVGPNAERVGISSPGSPVMMCNTAMGRVRMRVEQTSIGSDIAGLPAVVRRTMAMLYRKPGKVRRPSAAGRRARVRPEFVPRRDTAVRLKTLDVDPGIVTASVTLRSRGAFFAALG